MDEYPRCSLKATENVGKINGLHYRSLVKHNAARAQVIRAMEILRFPENPYKMKAKATFRAAEAPDQMRNHNEKQKLWLWNPDANGRPKIKPLSDFNV